VCPRVTNRILLGHIVGAHGIRGELQIKSYAEYPEDIAAYGPLTDETGKRTFEITDVRLTQKGILARIKGVDDRTAAEALKGTALMVDRSQLPEAEDGDYYHADLMGLKAVTPAGDPIGTIVAVPNFGAGDLLEIRLAGSKQTEYVTFTDAVVPTVDLTAGTVTVVMPVMVGDKEPDDEIAGDGSDADEPEGKA
jgi:16S rRNA processing protein RimM